MVFPTFFNLSLNLAIKSSWSEPQSAPGLFFFFFFWLTYRTSSCLSAKNIISLICIDDVYVWSLLLCCWKRVFAMTSAFSWPKFISLCPSSFYTPKPNFLVTPGIFWPPTFVFHAPIMKRTCVFGVSFRRSLQNRSTSGSSALLLKAYTWITVVLNDFPWKWTEIILSFFRLHPSTAFWSLLLTVMATPFLLRDSCPQ